MANESSSSPSSTRILCASFNQDNSSFVIGTKEGFKIFNSETGRLCYEKAIGAFNIVEMLFSTSLLAIVGAGEQPSLSPRRLCLFNTMTGAAIKELNFLTSILAVRLNRKRVIVLLQDKTYIYDANSLAILDTVDTVPNTKGLCAFSPNLDGCYLAIPASTTKGSVLVYDVMELQSYCEIDAHRSPLSAIVLSSNGMYIATASEQGTIVRVHMVSQATKSYSFRRGTYTSSIYSLSFGPSLQLPDILVATSSSGSVHVFSLALIINQRSKRSTSLLGSMFPDTVNDAFEPSHHHVLHNAVPAGVKSYAMVRNVQKISQGSPSPQVAIFRSSISIITYSGYFLEYKLGINQQNEASWTLEREFNLLTVLKEDVSKSK
ncbi:Autophagy-related protein 18b [Ranunculus cassubicifolius]